MKRRNFLATLAAIAAAPKALLRAEPQKFIGVDLARPGSERTVIAVGNPSADSWVQDRYVTATETLERNKAVVRTGNPNVYWRSQSARDLVDMLAQSNDIINDMEWK